MISFLIKLAVSAILLAALALQVDLLRAFLRLASIGVDTIVICFSLTLLQFTALAYRWNLVNRMLRMSLSFPDALRCTFAAQFFSQGLPASIGGDALRVWWLSRLDFPIRRATQSALLDRVAGLIALAVVNVFVAATLFSWATDSNGALTVAWVLVAAIVMVGVGTSRIISRLLFHIGRKVRAVLGRQNTFSWLLVWVFQLQRGAWRLVYSYAGLYVLLWGIAIHLTTVLLCYAVAVDARLSVTFLQLLIVVPPVMLLSYLPLSIGGWGLREGAMALGLSLVGVPKDDGAFLGLALGSLSLGAALFGAVVWLLSPSLALSGARRTAS